MSHEVPELKPIWVRSIAPPATGVVRLIAEKLEKVRTSRLRLAWQSPAEIQEMLLQTSVLNPAALLLAVAWSWPVRICRAACSTAESMALEARNIAPSSKIANSSARKGIEIIANSTAVAPPSAEAKAPKRRRAAGRKGGIGRRSLGRVTK